MEAASQQQLQDPGKRSDCTRQQWFINCGYAVLHHNWLYPLHSAKEKSKTRMEEVIWRMSVIWEWLVDSPLLTEFIILKLMICKIFAKCEKVHVWQSEATASSLDTSCITCTLSNFLLISFSLPQYFFKWNISSAYFKRLCFNLVLRL